MSLLPQFKCYLQGEVISIILSKWGFLHYCTLFFSFTVISTILNYIYFLCFHIHSLLSHLTLTSMKTGTRLFCSTDNYHSDVHLLFVVIVSCVQLFVTPWTAALQAPLSFTISWSLFKFMSIKSVMPSNHLMLCRPLLLPPSTFPSIRSFQMSQFFASGGQSTGVSASASVSPMNIQDWFPLGWTGWISLQSKGLSRVFSNTTVQKYKFFSAQPSL